MPGQDGGIAEEGSCALLTVLVVSERYSYPAVPADRISPCHLIQEIGTGAPPRSGSGSLTASVARSPIWIPINFSAALMRLCLQIRYHHEAPMRPYR